MRLEMRNISLRLRFALVFAIFGIAVLIHTGRAQKSAAPATPSIPRTWDDAAIATLEVPLADPVGSPKHASSEYYYQIPVQPIYKSYAVYAPGREPPGYVDWLKKQEPVVIWDDSGHAPPLRTESDWIKAGEIVFDADTEYDRTTNIAQTRDPDWYSKIGTPVAGDGTVPFFRYVVRKRGTVEVGIGSCARCHTRVMPDGAIVKGAQGNFATVRAVTYNARIRAQASDPVEFLARFRVLRKADWGMPWLKPDPEAPIDQMSLEDHLAAQDAFPAGVVPRPRSSLLYPVQVPDLIGVKDRKYLDHTGLQQHRSIADLMRYAAMNRGRFGGGDALANHSGFIPADPPNFNKLPDPATQARFSDSQLYALALYLYSIQPPANPNRLDALAIRGRKIFESQRCAMCHTPPLYTNNKLTPVEGFTPPPDHFQKYGILPISVGTDPNLATRTRRGTGYYKVPSLKGVWYRSMFGHSGWCATLEDWFDSRRTRDDYVPTGFKPYGAKTYAVKGHAFGLDLSDEDRKALIAFLRTL
jgi:hypothetical protein